MICFVACMDRYILWYLTLKSNLTSVPNQDHYVSKKINKEWCGFITQRWNCYRTTKWNVPQNRVIVSRYSDMSVMVPKITANQLVVQEHVQNNRGKSKLHFTDDGWIPSHKASHAETFPWNDTGMSSMLGQHCRWMELIKRFNGPGVTQASYNLQVISCSERSFSGIKYIPSRLHSIL